MKNEARRGLRERRFRSRRPENRSGRIKSLGAALKQLGRAFKAAATAFLGLAALALISAVLVAGYLYVSNSDYFSIKKVTISGLNKISRDDILKLAGLDRPVNIWLFDTDRAVAELSTLSWLEKAEIAKNMPDAATISIVERRPKLLVSLGRLFYLDDQGVPFKELEPGENPDLPIVTGFTEDELLGRTPGVRKALNELFMLTASLTARNDEFRLDEISEINFDAVRGLTVFSRRRDLEVKIGFGAYEEKFRRLGRTLAYLKLHDRFDGLVYINLEASPRVIVRYA